MANDELLEKETILPTFPTPRKLRVSSVGTIPVKKRLYSWMQSDYSILHHMMQ